MKSPCRIAINGFGRIGRLTLRALLQKADPNVEIVAINDLTDNPTLAHLFKYDSAHGIFPGNVSADDKTICIGDKTIHAFAEKDPTALPWGKLGIDIVLECTGRFTKQEDAAKHLQGGARKVLISAPAKGSGVRTIVLGINDSDLKPEDTIVSNASCTTNCLAPMAKVLDENFGIVEGFFTTVHAYTADQSLQDAPHKDLRRARAASVNIVPTTTGAAEAVGIAYPPVKGKITGVATRVPVITGSITDLNCVLAKPATVEAINAAFKAASEGAYKGLLEYSDLPLVSTDIVGNTHSCIFDSDMTMVLGKMVKILGWYDNESGYSNRLAELAVRMAHL